MAVEYTEGEIRLGKPPYKHPRWDTINNTNFDEIAKLGQDDTTSGANMVAIPSDIQSLFGNETTLKAVLQYIYDNYMHAVSGIFRTFEVQSIGLRGNLRHPCVARSELSQYQCVYLSQSAVMPETAYPAVSLSRASNQTTLPSFGIALSDASVGDTVNVATYGIISNKAWNWLLAADTMVDEHKYVMVGTDGYLDQWGAAGHEPTAIDLMGFVMNTDTIFLRPELTWSKEYA